MDTINGIDFITALRKEVNEYFSQKQIEKTANLNMYLKCILMLAIYIIPYLLMIFEVVDSSLFWLCWLMMGIGMAGVGMCIMHDGNHNAFSKNRSVNQIMGFTLQLLGGTYKNWKIQPNDILLTIVGTIGNTAIVKESDLPFSLQRSVAVLRVNEKIDRKFLFYWLNL